MPDQARFSSQFNLRILLAVLALAAAMLACNRPASRQQAASTEPNITAPSLNEEPAGGEEPAITQESSGIEEPAPPQIFVYLPFAPGQSAAGEAPEAPAAPTEQPVVPANQVDARVELEASATSIKVGDKLTIVGYPVELGLPMYYLIVRDEGVQEDSPLGVVSYENKYIQQDGTSQVLKVLSGEGGEESVTFVLEALAPGVTTVTISATGEIHGNDGSIWSGIGSGSIVITVTP